MIEYRTEKIKLICAEAVYNMYFECYKNALSEFEHAYLPLYDCYINENLSAKKNWDLDGLKDRAAYFAFKEYDLVKDYRPYYDSE